jgi:cytochrome P450
MSSEGISVCPAHESVDRRKSAPLAAKYVQPDAGAIRVKTAGLARAVMRSEKGFQAALGSEELHFDNPEHAPVFFLDGLLHRRKRMAIAKFLSPKAVATRHHKVMERTTEELLTKLRQRGEGKLDEIGFELAVAVVSDIIGLTNSPASARAKRLERALRSGTEPRKTGFGGRIQFLKMAFYSTLLLIMDVNPAKKARQKERQDDVISHLLDENYSDRAIMIECMTYGSAGMATTREFIVMVSWYLFEQPELRARYQASDEQGQLAILMEILRLEPVAGMLHRRVNEDMVEPDGQSLPSGELYAIDIRAVNTDEALVGACPFAVDPDRAARQRENGRYMSFGDGSHNCPGWQIALHETRIFMDRLLRVPGVRLARAPDLGWNPGLTSYELRNAVVVCDKAPA